MPDTITRIRVGTNTIGIIGLKHHLAEVAASLSNASDAEITDALLARLKKRNYIAPAATERYRDAFFTAYLKFVGREVPKEEGGPLAVRVLGTGCARCEKLEEDVRRILGTANITAECDHLREPKEIAAYGCFAYPGLVVNEELKLSGRLPSERELKALLGIPS